MPFGAFAETIPDKYATEACNLMENGIFTPRKCESITTYIVVETGEQVDVTRALAKHPDLSDEDIIAVLEDKEITLSQYHARQSEPVGIFTFDRVYKTKVLFYDKENNLVDIRLGNRVESNDIVWAVLFAILSVVIVVSGSLKEMGITTRPFFIITLVSPVSFLLFYYVAGYVGGMFVEAFALLVVLLFCASMQKRVSVPGLTLGLSLTGTLGILCNLADIDIYISIELLQVVITMLAMALCEHLGIKARQWLNKKRLVET